MPLQDRPQKQIARALEQVTEAYDRGRRRVRVAWLAVAVFALACFAFVVGFILGMHASPTPYTP